MGSAEPDLDIRHAEGVFVPAPREFEKISRLLRGKLLLPAHLAPLPGSGTPRQKALHAPNQVEDFRE